MNIHTIIGVMRYLIKRVKKTRTVVNLSSDTVELLGVCHPNYRGVSSSTKELTGGNIFAVSDIYSRRVAKKIAKRILNLNPVKIIISGYPTGYDLLIEELYRADSTVRIFAFIHSAFIWFDTYPNENKVFENFIRLAKDGKIEKIGFCKRDLAEYFATQGLKTYFVMNRFYPEKHSIKNLPKGRLKIGVFGANLWYRNITNQVIGALMLDDVEIHTNEISNHFFIDRNKVEVHGFLPKDEFLKLYKTMDVNMYISMTECFPMSVIESMQYGIPCLVSDTSDVYRWSPTLKKYLTVSTIDSPLGIMDKIKGVLDNYDLIQKEIKSYLPALHQKVESSIEDFLK